MICQNKLNLHKRHIDIMNLNLTRPLVFFDLETTGLNIGNDRIVEICMYKVLPNGTSQLKHEIVNPTVPIPPIASKIHGIWDKDVVDKPTFAEVAHQYSQFIENSDLAGYNSNRFDIPLLVEEFLRAGIDFEVKNRRFVDVQSIYHKMEPRNLSAAYKYYCNKELTDAHSAEADTMATYEILVNQIHKYNGVEIIDSEGNKSTPIINDIKALSEFSYYHRHADLSGQISYNDKNEEIFNFGKYKNRSVAEIFKIEPNYYDWMMKADFPLYTKKVITAIRMRDFNSK